MAKSLKHGLLSSCGVDTYKIASSNLIRRLSAPIPSRRDWDNDSARWHKSPNERESRDSCQWETPRGPGPLLRATTFVTLEFQIWQFNLKTVKGPVMWQSLIYFLKFAPVLLLRASHFPASNRSDWYPRYMALNSLNCGTWLIIVVYFGTEIQRTHFQGNSQFFPWNSWSTTWPKIQILVYRQVVEQIPTR